MFKYDQCAHAAAAQVRHALNNFINNARLILAFARVAVLTHGATAQLLQGLANFRLKQDDQHHRAIVHHAHQQPVQRCKAKQIRYKGGNQQYHQALKNGAGPGLPGHHKQEINDYRDNEYINYIAQSRPVKHIPQRGLDGIP